MLGRKSNSWCLFHYSFEHVASIPPVARVRFLFLNSAWHFRGQRAVAAGANGTHPVSITTENSRPGGL